MILLIFFHLVKWKQAQTVKTFQKSMISKKNIINSLPSLEVFLNIFLSSFYRRLMFDLLLYTKDNKK